MDLFKHTKRNTSSGEHPVVQAFRKKLESIADVIPELDALQSDADEELVKTKSTAPPPGRRKRQGSTSK